MAAAETDLLGLEVRLADLIRGVESRLAAQLEALGAALPQKQLNGDGNGLEHFDLVDGVDSLSVLHERCPDDDNVLGDSMQNGEAIEGNVAFSTSDGCISYSDHVSVLDSDQARSQENLICCNTPVSWAATHHDLGQGQDSMEGEQLEPLRRHEELVKMINRGGSRKRHARQRKTSYHSGLSRDDREDVDGRTRCLNKRSGLRPDGRARISFDLLSVFAVLYDSTLQPISLAWEIRNNNWIYAFSMCSLVFWTVDMFLNFMTGFYTANGELELRLGRIAKKYVKGWFFCDLTINGLDWVGIFLEFANDPGGSNSAARDISKAGRLVRTARILRIFRIVLRLKSLGRAIISPRTKTGLQAVQILTLVVWINHLLGCLWMGVGRLGELFYGQTWLDRDDGGILDIPYRDTSIVYQYFTAMHWSITQMTPGSMEVFPTNPLERIMNILCLIFGLLFGTSLTSQLSATMVQINMSRQKELEEVRDLRQYLQENKITTELARCIQEQIRLRMSVAKPKIEKNVRALEVLSGTLRLQLQSEIFTQLLNRHPLFNVWTCTEQNLVKDLCRLNALERILVNPGDELFNPNSKPDSVYLVLDGTLRYSIDEDNVRMSMIGMHKKDSRQDKMVTVGAWLCEPALWLDWSHTGTMVAALPSVLLKVSVPAVLEFMKKHVDTIGLMDAWSSAVSRIANTQRQHAHALDAGMDHGLVVMAMPDEARRRTVGAILDQTEDEGASTKWLTGRRNLSELVVEADEGKSVVIREGTGNLVRTVLVMVIRASRDDGKILVQLAKNKSDTWEPAVQLPGRKLAGQDDPYIVAKAFLKKQLSFLGIDLDSRRFETEVTMKNSEDFGLSTRYHSLVFEVRADSVEGEKTDRSSNTHGSRAISLRSSVFEQVSLDILPHDVVEHTVGQGQKAMFAWLSQTDFSELQADASQLKKFLIAKTARSRSVRGTLSALSGNRLSTQSRGASFSDFN
eukprot:TRINITY_DN23276_c0_g1_i1.p1 TRINITY_DN23276_c0_g1~~TRINITY_DN23276_c0_g1_i1.p1  ORF type:complete len:969 (-),score=142.91 TRINITY_DN23276_c0_g1_i1:43-2949(-)